MGKVGSEDAAGLIEHLYPRIFGALALYLADDALAEDLAQETMLRLWRDRSRVSEVDHPDRWALRVAFNLAKSRWRRLGIERRSHLHNGNQVPVSDPADALAVRAAVGELPPRQRAVIVLRYFNDLSVADAAQVLGCAEGTVKALTSQAIVKLTRELQFDFDTPEGDTA